MTDQIKFQLATRATSFDAIDITMDDVIWQLPQLARYNGAMWRRQWLDALQAGARASGKSRMAEEKIRRLQDATYSVAQHSSLMYDWGKAQGWTRQQLIFALLHDAPEIVIGDKTKPMQRWEESVIECAYQPIDLPKTYGDRPSQYEECPTQELAERLGDLEHSIWDKLGHDFRQDWREPSTRRFSAYANSDLRCVWDADVHIVVDEHMAAGMPWVEDKRPEPLGVDIVPMLINEARDMYVERCKEVGII